MLQTCVLCLQGSGSAGIRQFFFVLMVTFLHPNGYKRHRAASAKHVFIAGGILQDCHLGQALITLLFYLLCRFLVPPGRLSERLVQLGDAGGGGRNQVPGSSHQAPRNSQRCLSAWTPY